MDEVAYRQNLAKSIEKTSLESERMLSEARQEKMRYLEEFHSAQKKVSDLQNHLKDLEGHVVEKDALIRALQIPKGKSVARLGSRLGSSRSRLLISHVTICSPSYYYAHQDVAPASTRGH